MPQELKPQWNPIDATTDGTEKLYFGVLKVEAWLKFISKSLVTWYVLVKVWSEKQKLLQIVPEEKI